MTGLLSFLLFTPLVAALLALWVPSTSTPWFKWIALGSSIVQVFFLGALIGQYDPALSGFQGIEKAPWFSLEAGDWGKLQVEYCIGVDGLSFPLVALSVIIQLVAVIASFSVTKHVKGYFILLLVLNTSIIGSFVALDLFLFYLFFEFMLLPMFFLIGIWGGPRREYASVKFFIYTLLGSILILMVFIGLYLSYAVPGDGPGVTHTFNLLYLSDPANCITGSLFDPSRTDGAFFGSLRSWAFLFLFIGFAIKLPSVPFHTWLPDAHVEAPTPISVLLAALLLKMGGYGIIRMAYPLFPAEALHWSWLVGLMGAVSIVYGALNAMASSDLKRLIAYASVSHMGFVLLGLASVTPEGVAGAAYQLFSHGLITSMLFIVAGVIYDRTGDRTIANYSGLATPMPMYFTFVLLAFFAAMGLPGFSGFIAEILVLLGAFQSGTANHLLHPALAVVATSGLVLGAAYSLWVIQRMFFGKYSTKINPTTTVLTDLTVREYIQLVPLALLTVVLGIFPHVLLQYINPFATALVEGMLNMGASVLNLPNP